MGGDCYLSLNEWARVYAYRTSYDGAETDLPCPTPKRALFEGSEFLLASSFYSLDV